MNILTNLQFILPIIINGIILKYLYRLDRIKCICSYIPEKENLKTGYWIFILLSVFNMMGLSTYFGRLFGIKNKGILSISSGLLGLYLIYVAYILVTSIKFVRKLKKIKCACSENWKREFMYISNILNISILFLIVLFIIIATILLIIIGYNTLLTNIISSSKK